MDNGQWEGDEPKCVLARCPLPQSLANGDIVASDTIYRSIARYTCHRGYELKGSVERVCLSDETWSGADPTCVAITCSTDKLHLEYGRIIGNFLIINRCVYITLKKVELPITMITTVSHIVR